MSNTATSTDTRPANPACEVCNGTGLDTAFGSDCTQCWIDADRDALLAARYEGVRTLPSDRAYTPGERLDGRTFGGSTDNAASDKQLAFIERLLAERDRSNEKADAECSAVEQLAEDGPLTKKAASRVIDLLLTMPKAGAQRPTTAAPAPAAAPTRPNRYDGSCADCGGRVPAGAGTLAGQPGAWVIRHADGDCEEAPADSGLDLSTLSAFASNGKLRVAVPGGDTRLKLSIRFRRNGMIYVDDAAVYGHGASYGRQRPSGSYDGDCADELEAILADPHAAVARYGQLTNSCGVCGRPLEDADSVARGIGPVCAQRFG